MYINLGDLLSKMLSKHGKFYIRGSQLWVNIPVAIKNSPDFKFNKDTKLKITLLEGKLIIEKL